jgi:hypothetical protein
MARVAKNYKYRLADDFGWSSIPFNPFFKLSII